MIQKRVNGFGDMRFPNPSLTERSPTKAGIILVVATVYVAHIGKNPLVGTGVRIPWTSSHPTSSLNQPYDG